MWPATADGTDNDPTDKELHALLVACPELRELERRLAGFNLFRVLRHAAGELRHSNVLAWLLTPDDSHGLGDRFLRRWLMRVLHDAEITTDIPVADVNVSFFRSVNVLREWGRIDVLVRVVLDDDEWIVAIENKINATQGWQQLDRYRKRVEAHFPRAKRALIFLTMRDEQPEDEQWIVANYRQVVEILDECVEERRDAIGRDPLVLIDHFRSIIRELSMPDPKLVELARSIYGRHQRALDFIYDNRVDELALLTEALTKRMNDAAEAAAITPLNCHQGSVKFIPKSWDTPKNRAGKAWGDPSAYVICEIALRSAQPWLKIVEGKSPIFWRTKLFEAAKKDKATFTVRAKMPGQHMTVYQQKVVGLGPDEDPDIAAEAIWKFCAAHLKEARFRTACDQIVTLVDELPAP